MSSFYWVLTAIFVTIFSWIGPVSAAPKKRVVLFKNCEGKLARPNQTQIIKKAISNPVDLYFELYERDLKFSEKTGSRDFPVRDLFGEDLKILRDDLIKSIEVFKMNDDKIPLELASRVLKKAQALLKKDFGYLSYCDFTKAWVLIMNLYNNSSKDILTEQRAEKFIDAYLDRAEPRPIAESGAILSYYQFPQYSLPSISSLDRMDIVLMSSAPLTIRRLSTEKEWVDVGFLLPSTNEVHDLIHAKAQQIVDTGPVKFVPRFQSIKDLRLHLEQKYSATKHIVEKIRMTDDYIEHLRLDQMVYYYSHEETFASIEYFGSNYGGALFKDGKLFPDGSPSSFFLSKEEQQALKDAPRPPETREKTVETLTRWYEEGGGPKHPPK